MTTNPDNTDKLDIPGFDDTYDELVKLYKASDDPDLKEIAKLALNSYTEQMKDIMMIEPKYRARALEVANQYLSLAKDALNRNEELSIKRERLKPKSDDEPSDTGFDANELLLKLTGSDK